MKIRLVVPVLLLFGFAPSLPGAVELPGDNFFQGWLRSGKAARFVKDDLFNYIDGAAELFQEFGFEDVVSQSYKKGEEKLVLDLYRMENPVAALGIYLMKCGKETKVKGIRARNSGNRSQVTIVCGSHFIQITNFSGKAANLEVMAAAADILLPQLAADSPEGIFDPLPKEKRIPGSERILLGPYALQSIFTFGKGNILNLGKDARAVAADYKEDKGEPFTRIHISYKNEKAAAAAFQHLIANFDPYHTILDKGESRFSFRDFKKRFGTVERKGGNIEIAVNLTKKP